MQPDKGLAASAPGLDLGLPNVMQAYASVYSGHNQINRLLHIASKKQAATELPALRLAHDLVKKVPCHKRMHAPNCKQWVLSCLPRCCAD